MVLGVELDLSQIRGLKRLKVAIPFASSKSVTVEKLAP
jgi:hypothetical protein